MAPEDVDVEAHRFTNRLGVTDPPFDSLRANGGGGLASDGVRGLIELHSYRCASMKASVLSHAAAEASAYSS